MTSSMAAATVLKLLVCPGDHQYQVVEGSSGDISNPKPGLTKKLISKILGVFAMSDQVPMPRELL